MDAVNFLKEFKRMCQSYQRCAICPLNDTECCAMLPFYDIGEDIVRIVEQWSKDHPKKTRKKDFLERYPNAPIEVDGTPKACCENLGYCKDCNAEVDCVSCWNKAMEEN